MPNPRQPQSVPFMAAVKAQLMPYPVADMIKRDLIAAIDASLRLTVAPVPCPACGRVLAVLVRDARRLYRPGPNDQTLGAPFSKSPRENVTLRCRPCLKGFDASGRSVARNLHNGRPLLT